VCCFAQFGFIRFCARSSDGQSNYLLTRGSKAKSDSSYSFRFNEMARPERLELPTLWFEARWFSVEQLVGSFQQQRPVEPAVSHRTTKKRIDERPDPSQNAAGILMNETFDGVPALL
jgi:hypothetical protein